MTSNKNQDPPTGHESSSVMHNKPPEHTTINVGEQDSTLFSNKQIRSQFVSKVYTIVFLQLLAASALIALFTLHEPTRQYFKSDPGDVWLVAAAVAGLVTCIILVCVESARRSFPINFILLVILTVAYGLVAAIFSAQFSTITVLSAFLATALATFTVMMLAKYSSFDMTTCGCGLLVLGVLHLLVGIILTTVLVPMGLAGTASLVYATLGAFLVSLFMLYDLQLIMGGRKVELSPEEYILGAVILYIDIIQLFQYMLMLFAGRD